MRTIFQHQAAIYTIATVASLSIMLIVDYVLGAEAEHLNAWVILNRLLGNATTVGDSLAIQKLGLAGATLLMLAINFVFGFILIKLITLTIKFIHWL